VDNIMLVIVVSLMVALVVPPLAVALLVRSIAMPEKDCRRPSSRRLIGALGRETL
jgi:hypothetical protein